MPEADQRKREPKERIQADSFRVRFIQKETIDKPRNLAREIGKRAEGGEPGILKIISHREATERSRYLPSRFLPARKRTKRGRPGRGEGEVADGGRGNAKKLAAYTTLWNESGERRGGEGR